MRPALNCTLLALLCAVTAALFDAESLWVPSIALALLAAGSVIWVACAARSVSLRRALGARRVVEDEPLDVVLEVRGGRLSMASAAIVDPLLGATVPLPAGRGRRRVRVEVRFARRGRRVLAPPRLRICDPLGLATREIAAPPAADGDEILVLPRIEPVVAGTGGDGGAADIARCGRTLLSAEVSVDGIRPLREGTPAARIFWPSIARGGEPQERRLTAASDSRPLVVLDPRGAAGSEQLDAAVRATASLARALAEAGGCLLLLPGDRRPTELGRTLAGWDRAHARMALLGSSCGPALASVARRRGPVVFVSARSRARLPQALAASAGATRLLVIPRALPGRTAAFAVAGCHGYVLSRARTTAAASGPVAEARP